ncbi:MAG: ABC transporter substrate-binding protein [Clostridiales bacterium]|nr:ABC transporter substrate-binding protein [Clostridiales bacterium]
MEKIYTIPVNEAYESQCDCPLCALRQKAENDYLEYYLGPSLMEPDTRVITNKTGFCPDHMGKLNKREAKRLGLGLMLHTHLKDFDEDISKEIKAAAPGKAGLIKGRTTDYKAKLNAIADKIDGRVKLCPICDKINYTMDRYLEVISYLYAKDPAFREKFKRTHCLPHTAMLLRTAAGKMSQNEASDLVADIADNNSKAFEGLIADVEWFTLKFDYRNTDKPWGNSKNAIQRSMRFLSSDRSDFDETGKK